MTKHLYYFGCIRQVGHYLWKSDGCSASENELRVVHDVNPNLLRCIDGIFPPTQVQEEGLYNDCIVPPLRIVAWWDRSVDKRPGSHSTLLAIGYDSAEEMLDAAMVQFPSVMNRQKRPTPYQFKP